ncbi:MAG TPA: FAD-binding oxidoreductase [Pseudorhodoferax sp.]|nr:FAD-binding oxidoreductase [Pseudorhodoferax sp.]
MALRAALGDDAVAVGEAIPERHLTDWSGVPAVRPLALLRPRSTQQVSAALQLCSQHRVPVVPQGGMTGLAGAAQPLAQGVALSLDRMQAIEQLDAATRTLTVQAGATVQSVQEAASAQGQLFGVDFGARGSAQVGGALATNAGGNGVLRFGMMREQTLGLEVVLADGSVLPMLRPMQKNNTGYDLKQFFIGAEGTLGVITRALLRLHPAPATRVTMLAAVPDYAAALALLARLQARAGAGLAAFELMWRDFVVASLAWQQLREPFAAPHPLLALVDLDGPDAAQLQAALEEVLAPALQDGLVLDAAIAQSEAQARAFWKIREATAELPARMHPPVNFDVSLPMAEIGRFASACRAALDARWPGHASVFFGHIGDSNLHVSTDASTIGGDVHGLEQLVYDLVGDFAGSVSAEHGIGLHKKPYLGRSRTPAELAAMRAVKAALDPLHLMNPGKIFD